MATKKADGSSLQDYKKIKELIDVTNKDLRGRGHKASLEIFRESIYIRGTFPPKGRTKINSGVKASIKGVSIAETRLMDLLVAIKTSGSIPTPLPWQNKILSKVGYPKVKVSDAIGQLKKDFFNVETSNSKSRLNTWKTMEYGLNKLDPGAYVTTDYLIAQIIDKSIDPKTGLTRANQKLKLKQYYKRLGRLIGLPDIEKIDQIEIVYEPKKRDIPDHGTLLDLAEELIVHKKYGWITAATIIYGCRPSEVFSLFPSTDPRTKGTAKVFTIKKKKGLPTIRTAMALPAELVDKLDLNQISRPLEFKHPKEFDPKATKYLTDSWGSWLDKKYPGLNLYDLRHSWAKRSINEGVPTGLAARCLGHSITVFEKTYLSTIDEKDVADYISGNR